MRYQYHWLTSDLFLKSRWILRVMGPNIHRRSVPLFIVLARTKQGPYPLPALALWRGAALAQRFCAGVNSFDSFSSVRI